MDKGRTWVKLSVTYDNTKDGPPTYDDITVAQAYVKASPGRMVWQLAASERDEKA